MKNKFSSHSGGMMVELVIVIGFFVIISVFIMKMFAATEKIRGEAEEVSKATIHAENTLETFKGHDSADNTTTEYLYDKNWKLLEQGESEEPRYVLTIEGSTSPCGLGFIQNYTVKVERRDSNNVVFAIYSLTGSFFKGGNGNE